MKMIKLLKIVLFCAYVYSATSNLTYDACLTPVKQQGFCKPIKQCAPLYSLLGNLTPQITTYLRQSHCGFEKQHPKVCCPNNTLTETGSIYFKPESTSQGKNIGTTILEHSLLPSKEICGSATEDRPIGGIFLYVYQYPWTAVLIYQENNQKKVYCGGTVISTRYVLTAAQCIHGRDLPGGIKLVSVRLREHNFTSNPDCEDFPCGKQCGDPFIDVPIEETIVHEDYQADDANHRHDIALIRLNKTVSFNGFLQPLCLPARTNAHKNYTGVRLIQPGWGINNKKVAGSVRTRTEVVGQSVEHCSTMFGFNLEQNQLCTSKHGSSKSCSLDIGASTMNFGFDEESVNYYAAVVASAGTCDGNQPALYTKVGAYSDWILSKLQK